MNSAAENWLRANGYPDGSPSTIMPLIDRWVTHTPNAVAVTDDRESLSYAELASRAAALARHLADRGLDKSRPVGVCLPRSVDLIVALLAVLRAGGAYLPLDPDLPAERLRYMIGDADVGLLISDGASPVAGLATAPVSAGRDGQPDAAPPEPQAGDLAYVIYTSGSTGQPKGVQIEHQSVLNLVVSAAATVGIGAGGSTWTMFHSFAFDFSVWEIWGCLAVGGRLVVVPYLTARNPAEFARLLAGEQVTVLNLTPSAFRQMTAELLAYRAELALTHLIFGGEALTVADLADWLEPAGITRVVNMYGITEITVHGTFKILGPSDLGGPAHSPIGQALPGYEALIVDENLRPVPTGVPGELLIGGAGVARGYLNRPQLTAERFIHTPHGRMYRSGDLARQHPDGQIDYLGRIDRQIKLRGYRIEPAEIEATLTSHPAILTAITDLRTTPHGDPRLTAYIIPASPDTHPDPHDLHHWCATRLPSYMIPATYITIDQIPITINGKIDYAKLPAPEPATGLSLVQSADLTSDEACLAATWSAVLGSLVLDSPRSFAAADNFFHVGGDSLSAIRVVGELARQGVTLEVRDIFECSTLAAIASRLRRAGATAGEPGYRPFSQLSPADLAALPDAIEDAYPLAAAQQGMLLEMARHPDILPYHNCASFLLTNLASTDRAAVTAAIKTLCAVHPALRTTFATEGFTEGLQFVHKDVAPETGFIDLSAAPDAEAIISAFVETQVTEPMNYGAGPLTRFRFYRLSNSSGHLAVAHTHAILDGWSLAKLAQDVRQLLQGVALTPQPNLMSESLLLERQAAADEHDLQFWRDRLAGVAGLSLIPARSAGQPSTTEIDFPIDDALRARLADVAQQAGVPVKSLYLAAHMRLMSMYGRDGAAVSGLVCNGRPETTAGGQAVGMFLNVAPITIAAIPGTWRDLAQDLFAEEAAVQAHRRVPLPVIKSLHPDGLRLDAWFNYYDFSGLGYGQYRSRVIEAGTTEIPLAVNASPHSVTIQANGRYWGPAETAALGQAFVECLRSLAADPSADPRALSLGGALRGPVDDTWQTPILAAVAASAASHPRATALRQGAEEISYGELDRRSTADAASLLAQVTTGTIVGICLPRSIDLVVALLAVLRAGGAYLPMDPDLPAERLKFMYKDAGAAIVLTDENGSAALRDAGLLPTLLPPTLDDQLERADPARQPTALTPDDLAYVIYTSGSTGTPKGVAVTHGGLASALAATADAVRCDARDVVAMRTSLMFDIATVELWMPLSRGATVALTTPDEALPWAFGQFINDQQITIAQATPSAWSGILDSGWQPSDGPAGEPGALRLLAGGEPLPDLLAGRLSALAETFNLYGPTEATVYCSMSRVSGDEPITIGRPLANVVLALADSNGALVPAGVPGELLIGGAGVARGYLNRPQLTAERFIHTPHGRMYRSGDLARQHPDGQIDYLGRIDRQIKLRGYRIEPAEIEATLTSHPAILTAITDLRTTPHGDPRLTAYIIPASPDTHPDPHDLHHWCATRLPSYMIPATYITIDQIPITINGKIDYAKLPAPEPADEPPDDESLDEVEHQVAQVWASVLQSQPPGRDDDFFLAGGNSLSLIRLADLLRSNDLHVELDELFSHPTVAGIAAAGRGRGRGGADD